METHPNPHLIIDKQALLKNRERALRIAKKDADFLLQHVADDLALRLSTITKPFSDVAVLNCASDAIKNMLESRDNLSNLIQTKSPAFSQARAVVCDDDVVPFANESFDLMISALNLQFIDDLPGTLIQIRRALRSDGLFMGVIAGGGTLQELRQSFLAAEAALTGGVAQRVLPFIDVREAGHLLQRAGFALPVTDTEQITVRYQTPLHLMHDLRAMGAVNCTLGRSKTWLRRDVLQYMVSHYVDHFSDDDGRIRATFEIISLSGWAPHESQQKPLKPGSAQVSLADTLGKTR